MPVPAARVFVAIDRMDRAGAKADAARLGPGAGGIKLGLEFFVANGPDGIRDVAGTTPLFLDLKLHDIPNTVAGGVKAACQLAPRFLTIHAAGGRAMMQAAATAAREAGGATRPKLLGVTVLTSLDDADLADIGVAAKSGDQAKRLAALAQESGLDGIICSPLEVAALRKQCGAGFVLMVPGIRPAWSASQDQKRVMTPAEAVAAGADYLVIGRPITQADNPAAALDRIGAELAAIG
jgi:orotidine-5'-phosphate decarboxylase